MCKVVKFASLVFASFLILTAGVSGAKMVFGHNNEVFSEVLDVPLDKQTNNYQKLNPDLYMKIKDMNPEDRIKISIFLKFPDRDNIKIKNLKYYKENLKLMGLRPTALTNKSLYKEFYKELMQAKKELVLLREKPVIEFMEEHDAKILYVSKYAPLIFAEVPSKLVFELVERDDIARIDLCRKVNLEIDSAVPTIHAPSVWSEGYTGDGVKVAIVEADRVDFRNPYISGEAFIPFGYVGRHATEVAGVVASTNLTYKGVAYDAYILSANSIIYWDFALIKATEWALDKGADVLSLSFWTDDDLIMDNIDMYYDYIVENYYQAVVKSAGNRGWSDGNVTSPGLGWNVITVGGIDDNDTADWSDDSRATFSSYRDPISPHGDRNKPEVSAVAENIRSTETKEYHDTYGTWITRYEDRVAGTSYAAPAVAGEIALLINSKWYLAYWPEVTKAIVMASAIHNTYGDIIDDMEGVGTIDAYQAYKIVKEGKFRMWNITEEDLPKIVYFNASEGERVRGVIVWNSHASCSWFGCSDTLASDLDLEIYDPNGNLVAKSNSYDNNYEIVDFVAQMDGTYKAKIVAKRFDADYEYVGAAKWSSKYLSESG